MPSHSCRGRPGLACVFTAATSSVWIGVSGLLSTGTDTLCRLAETHTLLVNRSSLTPVAAEVDFSATKPVLLRLGTLCDLGRLRLPVWLPAPRHALAWPVPDGESSLAVRLGRNFKKSTAFTRQAQGSRLVRCARVARREGANVKSAFHNCSAPLHITSAIS